MLLKKEEFLLWVSAWRQWSPDEKWSKSHCKTAMTWMRKFNPCLRSKRKSKGAPRDKSSINVKTQVSRENACFSNKLRKDSTSSWNPAVMFYWQELVSLGRAMNVISLASVNVSICLLYSSRLQPRAKPFTTELPFQHRNWTKGMRIFSKLWFRVNQKCINCQWETETVKILSSQEEENDNLCLFAFGV